MLVGAIGVQEVDGRLINHVEEDGGPRFLPTVTAQEEIVRAVFEYLGQW